MFSSLCLLVLLGAVLVSAAPKQFITENLKSSQNLIADELGLKKPEVGSSPLFSSIIKSFNTTCQTSEDLELINATMDVYARIFSSVLHQNQSHHHLQGAPSLLSHVSDAQRSNVVSELTSLQQVMENLRSRLH
uniref:Uncharacterized protein n=2 Tax=Gouania willdenowi TaxID=441366 RepID=A0A8C5D2H3_GOUWI